MIRSILQLWLIVTLSLALTGCKKENPNPELIDPIWKDLTARHAAYQKNYEESKAKISALQESIAKTEARTIELRSLEKDLSKEKMMLVNAEQLSRYYRIRAERRKVTARIAYKKAFSEETAWPDPREYSEYLVNIRLQESSRNWAARVPKLQDRMPGSAPQKPKAEPAAGGH